MLLFFVVVEGGIMATQSQKVISNALSIEVMLSFQFTGLTDDFRSSSLADPIGKIERSKLSHFCSNEHEDFFKEMSTNDIYDFCLKKQRDCKNILFFFMSERESTGMIKELKLAEELNQPAHIEIVEGCGIQDWMIPFMEYAERNPWLEARYIF